MSEDLNGTVVSLGTGVFEILLASISSIKPGAAHLGVTNVSINFKWKTSDGDEVTQKMQDGFLAIHHPVTLRNQIVIGPIDIILYRMDADIIVRVQMLYRSVI